jgi:hypothetical protein
MWQVENNLMQLFCVQHSISGNQDKGLLVVMRCTETLEQTCLETRAAVRPSAAM